MQPYFMPYIGYFQLIKAVDKFIIYDDVNYINRGWINRNRILLNKSPFMLTLPLIKASQNKLINEIDINNLNNWRVKQLKSIALAYKKAPYFNSVFPLIEDNFNCEIENLSEFVTYSLKSICNFLEIGTEIISTSTSYRNKQLGGQQRILDICLQEGVSTYINPIGGVELYDKELFSRNNVELKFIRSNPIEYKQFKGVYEPWLSIIDVLMFNSLSQVNDLLTEYRLI